MSTWRPVRAKPCQTDGGIQCQEKDDHFHDDAHLHSPRFSLRQLDHLVELLDQLERQVLTQLGETIVQEVGTGPTATNIWPKAAANQ